MVRLKPRLPRGGRVGKNFKKLGRNDRKMNNVSQMQTQPFAQSLNGETGAGYSNGYMALQNLAHHERPPAEAKAPAYVLPVRLEKGEGGSLSPDNYARTLPWNIRQMVAAIPLANHKAMSVQHSQLLSREDAVQSPIQALPAKNANTIGGQKKDPGKGIHQVQKWHREDAGIGLHPIIRSRAKIQAAWNGA